MLKIQTLCYPALCHHVSSLQCSEELQCLCLQGEALQAELPYKEICMVVQLADSAVWATVLYLRSVIIQVPSVAEQF
jgi:hypothetical protein